MPNNSHSKEALLYNHLEEKKVACRLCAQKCVIADGKRGFCNVRENRDGTLYTLVYGRTIASNTDPVEKKPFYHFQPGSLAYSIATPGCNFRCQWCQNCEISQAPSRRHLTLGTPMTPQQIVHTAQGNSCTSIAYTYTEPTVFFEYSYDTARHAREKGLANIYVTNGYMTNDMLDLMYPYLDAATVDLKAFRDETYWTYARAHLEPVLESLRKMKEQNVWTEVTTLVIPGINDDEQELRDAARFLSQELGPETPWHLSRFFPAFRMTHLPPTPVSTLRRACEIGREEGLSYVYLGNTGEGADTACPSCGSTVIRRSGFHASRNLLDENGRCPHCGTRICGVGMGSESEHGATGTDT